jgi:queuosine precursor transporter
MANANNSNRKLRLIRQKELHLKANNSAVHSNDTFDHPHRQYKYYDLVMAAFVAILLCANLIGASKRTIVGGFTFGAGILFFPISYVFGDILTEVYGYARSRRVIWAGFGAMIFASFMSYVVVAMPPAPGWDGQEVYEKAFGSTWRIASASLIAFWAGEFANSMTLAKMKVGMEGRFLWIRTIGSTIIGEAVDSLIFYPLAFAAILSLPGWTWPQVMEVMFHNYLLKVLWEVVMTPVTYRVVAFLKRVENEDYYDRKTNFNPFSLEA